MKFSQELKEFIENERWIFAKTYAKTWPHEYIVQENVNNDFFIELGNHIDRYGYKEFFYKIKQTYFEYNGNTYWHMGNIINRCPKAETYHAKRNSGNLPNF